MAPTAKTTEAGCPILSFYIIGGIGVLAAVLAVLSFYVFHVAVLGVLFAIITIALVVLLIWITWIRRQYAFGGGGIMEQVHRVVPRTWTMTVREDSGSRLRLRSIDNPCGSDMAESKK